MKAKTEQTRGQQRDRKGRKASAVWLEAEMHAALRKRLIDLGTNFQDWATAQVERELQKAQP